MHRRTFLIASTGAVTAFVSGQARSQQHHNSQLPEAAPSAEPFAKLQGGIPHHLTSEQEAQRVIASPAPAGPPGRWITRAALPLPRSEMAWATAWDGRMYIVGGYGEGRVDRAYNHIYDPSWDRWYHGAPLPRGANHVAVAADNGRVYAMGGFIEQNRNPDRNAYVYDIGADRWSSIAPLPRPRGAAASAVVGGKIYLIGGATEPTRERASIGWTEVYDPQTDSWSQLKPLPGARDHAGCVAHEGRIHIIGGRFNTFEYNTGLHHVYLPDDDSWKELGAASHPRAPATGLWPIVDGSTRWAARQA